MYQSLKSPGFLSLYVTSQGVLGWAGLGTGSLNM